MALEIEIGLRRFRSTPNKVSWLIADLVPKRATWYKTNKSLGTATDFLWAWQQLAPFFGKSMFNALSQDMIEDYKMQRVLKVCKRTIQRELSYLSSMWKWAYKHNYCSKPHFEIETYDKEQVRSAPPTPLTPQETQSLLDCMHPDRWLLIALMYYCGLRVTETCTLERSKIHLDSMLLEVKGKGSKTRMVPILYIPELVAKLKEALKTPNGTNYLVINPETMAPYKDIRAGIKAAAIRAGITKRVYPHLFRHCYCTHSAEAGVDARTVQGNAGHSELATTEIYTHLVAQHRKKETQKLSKYLRNTVTTREKFIPKNRKKAKPLQIPT